MSQTATLILTHGQIHTLDRANPLAEAVAIADGKIVATGSHDRIMSFAAEGTQIVDLKGHTVIPGLNDSHLHLIRGGLNYNLELRWRACPRWPMPCECLRIRRIAHRRRSGCGWSAAGANSSSPNDGCRPWKS